jgi:hypothetical protein
MQTEIQTNFRVFGFGGLVFGWDFSVCSVKACWILNESGEKEKIFGVQKTVKGRAEKERGSKKAKKEE